MLLVIMKKIIPFLTILLIVTPSFGQYKAAVPQKRSIDIDGYAAKVNDEIITRSDVREALAPQLPAIYQQFKGAQLEVELKKAFSNILDQLIERTLIMEAFKVRGGDIPAQYIDV